jgi:hypothetical protein
MSISLGHIDIYPLYNRHASSTALHYDHAMILRYRITEELNAIIERFPRVYRRTRRPVLFSWLMWQRISSESHRRG